VKVANFESSYVREPNGCKQNKIKINKYGSSFIYLYLFVFGVLYFRTEEGSFLYSWSAYYTSWQQKYDS